MHKTSSAGAILISKQGKIALVSNRGRSWTFPKGHIEPGETAQQAMFREIKEETGISDIACMKQLGTYERPRISYDKTDDEAELKEITLFLCLTDELELAPEDPDNPEAKWVGTDHVTEMLTHKLDKQFYQSVQTEVAGIARIDRTELFEALDQMAFNADLASRQPEKEHEFRQEYLYDDPDTYEGTKKLFEDYGYKFGRGLWQVQQLRFQLANEATEKRLAG